MRKTTIAKYKKKVWYLFSRYIRQRDADWKGDIRCITCLKQMHWKKSQGGHFIHGNTKKTYFNEKNVHAQCAGCNLYGHGKRDLYALRLIQKYGISIIEELHEINKEKFLWNKSKIQEVEKDIIQKLLKYE